MTEQEILEQIRRSAESVVTPKSLAPENLLEKCLAKEPGTTGAKNWKNTHNIPKRKPAALSALAAALFALCFISLRTISGSIRTDQSGFAGNGSTDISMAETDSGTSTSEAGTAEETNTEAAADTRQESVLRKDAGTLYTLAGSYDTVYASLEELSSAWDDTMCGGEEGTADRGYGAMESPSGTANSTNEDMSKYAMADAESEKQELTLESSEEDNYSRTNVQTLGIDESDIVKTDGRYLYLLRGSCVSIVSATGETMRQVSELKAEGDSGAAKARAMYVEGDTLILILSESDSSLQQDPDRDGSRYDYKLDYLDTDLYTSVLTYDISDRRHPVLAGKVTQDGDYVTSRKDGRILYLFTEQYLLEDYRHDPESAIPQAGGRKVAEDCIYLGDRGERALLVSSLSADQPKSLRDTVMLLDAGSEIYMGENSLYLYRTVYQSGSETTQIAKFSLRNGYLNGEAAASVRGAVRDTFAIHEKADKLRILTTDTSGSDPENCLFLLDEKLKLTGTLAHIAVGESIYAARFLGDMAYFITYRNTDPLFAADLSDETNPKLVGELEITGFSEYLHFWGRDKLLGLGYETDPANGAREGLKLVMFDMSDPAELKVLDSKALDKTDYSPALYDYKAVLADPAENLIGFVSESYQNDVKRRYELYQWDGKNFQKLLSEDLKDDYEGENYRGLFIGERFYIAHPEILRSYDREDYSLMQTLKME